MNDRLGIGRALQEALSGTVVSSRAINPRLTVILDEIGEPSRSSVSRYGEELTKALISTAPRELEIAAVAAGARDAERDALEERFPGIAELRLARIPVRELREAWLHSITTMQVPGLVHATSLLAPMRSDGKAADDQWVVTVHGDTAISDRSSKKAKWFDRALRRAYRLADAVVVPTHAVAQRVAEHYDFGDRLRVIAGGVAPSLQVPIDAEARAVQLGLPETYVLAMTSASTRSAAHRIVDTLASSAMPDVPVVVVGAVGWDDTTIAALAVAAGLPASRMLMLGDLNDADLSVVYDRASVMLATDTNDGFGLSLLEAFSFGTPVVHLAHPSLVEIAEGASIAVPMVGDDSQAHRIATAIASLLGDSQGRESLAQLGRDRGKLFSFENAATQIWQLHADL